MVRTTLISFLLMAGCGGKPDDGMPLPDNDHDGDSMLLPGGKVDATSSIPRTLGLDLHKKIYLTFDDGPSGALTPQILDILKANNIQVTFFITGVNIAGHESIIAREAAEGHNVGNHQWKHVVATMDEFEPWLNEEHDALAAINPDQPLYYRYPYGAGASWKEDILKAHGYLHGGIGWNIDSMDWDYGSDAHSDKVPAQYADDFEGWVMHQVKTTGGGVILMHDIQSITVGHLQSIIDKIRAEGFTFAQFPKQLMVVQPAAQKFIGDACSKDTDCNFGGGFCMNGMCSENCDSTCPDSSGHNITRCVQADDQDDQKVCALTCNPDMSCTLGTCKAVDGRNVCL
jgi:peptidoglycan/xylan/chitin deacetylase (PgdA/CDA1 family)